MNITFIQSRCNKPYAQQDIACLRIKNLSICVERSYGHTRPHLLYNCNAYEQELKQKGHHVTVSDIAIPLDHSALNELDCTMYHAGEFAVFLFSSLAVRCSKDVTIDYFCKDDLSLQEAAAHWGIEVTSAFLEPMLHLHVPNDLYGKLAMALEQFLYQCWDTLERAPGEVFCAEERLSELVDLYQCLAARDPAKLDDMFQDTQDTLRYFLEWNREALELPPEDLRLRAYYEENLKTGRQLMQQLTALKKEIRTKLFDRRQPPSQPGDCVFFSNMIYPLCKPAPFDEGESHSSDDIPF